VTVSTLPILYSFRRCLYAIRTRMVLAYCQQQVELREVVLKNKPDCMLSYSPKGTVPVLVINNSTVLEESLDIIFWALERSDSDLWWLGLNKANKQTIQSLIEKNDGEFKAALDRYKYADRYPEQSATNYRQQAEKFLVILEQRLSEHTFLLGNKITLADVSLFPFIRQFAFVDKNWFDQSDYKNLQAWLEHHLSSDLFSQVMEKYSPWQLGDAPRYFLTGQS
jgi:glutathione S-transferase